MNAPTVQSAVSSPVSCELDLLLAAISDAIEALKTWNVTAFQAAVDRQSSICERISVASAIQQSAHLDETVRKVQELNRIYDRLLQHSIHWTRTIQSILMTSGDPFRRHASVHFRG